MDSEWEDAQTVLRVEPERGAPTVVRRQLNCDVTSHGSTPLVATAWDAAFPLFEELDQVTETRFFEVETSSPVVFGTGHDDCRDGSVEARNLAARRGFRKSV